MTTTTTEGRPQGDRPEGRQEHLEHPERQAPLGREVPRQMGDQEHREPLGREDQGREDQGREVPRQMGDQEHRGDTHRCEDVEEAR